MLIGVISDTHDNRVTAKAAFVYFRERNVDLVVHCGDWKSPDMITFIAEIADRYGIPVRGVLGNNDADVDAFMRLAEQAPGDFILTESTYTIPLQGEKYIAACHGHHEPTLRKLLQDDNCTVVLRGHSHKPLIDYKEDTLVVNPGSTAFAIPRRKDWQPSVAVLDTATLMAEIIYLPTV